MQHSRNASVPFYQSSIDNGPPPPKQFKSAANMSDRELAAMLEGADDYIAKRHMMDVAMSEDLLTPEARERAIDQANKDQDARFLRLKVLMLENSLQQAEGGIRWERDELSFIHVALVEDEVEDEQNEDTDGAGEEEEDEQDDTTTTTGSSSVVDEAGATIIMAAANNNDG